MNKNDILKGICVDYTHEGDGVVKSNNFTFFVPEVLKDEEITFKILKINKNYGYGKLISVDKPSDHRIKPSCPVFSKCGGCQLQHMDSFEQKRFKENIVKNNLERIGKINTKVNECLSMEFKPYRNKAQFPIKKENGELKIGFYRKHSNDIVNVEHCNMQLDEIDKVFNYITKIIVNYSFSKYLRHIVIKYSRINDEMMIVLVSKKAKLVNVDSFINKLVKEFKFIKSVILNVNDKNTNVILGNDEYILYGESVIKEHLCDNDYFLASKSFFQVNSYQSEVLYNEVLRLANLNENDTVADLYCGVGSISLCLAKQCKQVYAVEIVEAAIENAKNNAILNNINNVEFICGDAKDYSDYLVKHNIDIDVLVIDPPRKGLDEQTINNINKINPRKVVYVSCNPSTLARDLNIFTHLNYIVEEVTPVDMFYNTYHVESVALLMKEV